MKRMIIGLALALAIVTSMSVAASADTRTYLGFSIGVGTVPPPHIVFKRAPRMVRVPSMQVMVIADDPGYDMFQFGGWYYLFDGGFWYRSHRDDGGFRAIDVRTVPRDVLQVPADRWHHRAPVMAQRTFGDHDRGHDFAPAPERRDGDRPSQESQRGGWQRGGRNGDHR